MTTNDRGRSPPKTVGYSVEERLARVGRSLQQEAVGAAGAIADPVDLALRTTPLRVAFIIVLLCLWEGFPFSIIGMSALIGFQLLAVIAFVGVAMFVGTRLLFRGIGVWEITALALFLWCTFVSFMYSTRAVPQPLMQWLPAIYLVAPLLIIFALKAARATIGDALSAIYWTGLIASFAILVESIVHTGLLNYYARGSAFSEGRIVFFKLTSAFALMIAVTSLIQDRRPVRMMLNAVATVVMAYNVLILTESRLLIVAIALALVLWWVFALRGVRKILTGVIAPIVLLPLGAFLASRYLGSFSGLDDYLAQDISANWRRITDAHFAAYFYRETGGLGFGFMSANEIYDNVLSFSANRASKLYGVINYVVSLDDIGLMSALYQFGYVGFVVVVGMSLACIFTLARSIRLGRAFGPVAGIGVLMGTAMISPVSMNYFTLFYTAHIGGLLWFVASEVSRLLKLRDSSQSQIEGESAIETG